MEKLITLAVGGSIVAVILALVIRLIDPDQNSNVEITGAGVSAKIELTKSDPIEDGALKNNAPVINVNGAQGNTNVIVTGDGKVTISSGLDKKKTGF